MWKRAHKQAGGRVLSSKVLGSQSLEGRDAEQNLCIDSSWHGSHMQAPGNRHEPRSANPPRANREAHPLYYILDYIQ